MAITFATPDNTTSKGAAANGNITLTAPASPQVDDVWIAVIHSSDQVAHTFTDWTEIVQGNGGGTTSHISVWYFRYAGSTPNLTVTHSGGQSPIGGIVSFRGCKNTGSPVNVAGTIAGGTDATIEHSAISPSVAGCCLLVINGAADDNNRTALGGDYAIGMEDSAGGTQNSYHTALGNPDGSVCVFYDLSVASGTTGIVTVTQAAADPWAAVLVALEPGANPVSIDSEFKACGSIKSIASLGISSDSTVFGHSHLNEIISKQIDISSTVIGVAEIDTTPFLNIVLLGTEFRESSKTDPILGIAISCFTELAYNSILYNNLDVDSIVSKYLVISTNVNSILLTWRE